LADNLKKIRNRFRGRLHNSGRYGEFLKHHETDIGELLEIVEQQKQEIERLKKSLQFGVGLLGIF
jgi:cell division septum initiation protein DivIVA